MDIFTNFVVAGLIAVVVYIAGAVYIRVTNPDPYRYIWWLKVNAIAFPFTTTAFSFLLMWLFPQHGQDLGHLINGVVGGGTPGGDIPSSISSELP